MAKRADVVIGAAEQEPEPQVDVTLPGPVLHRYQSLPDRSGMNLRVLVWAAQKAAATKTPFTLKASDLAKRCNVSQMTARRALRDLRTSGLLFEVEKGGQGKATVYRVATTEDIEKLIVAPKKAKAKARKTAGKVIATRRKIQVKNPAADEAAAPAHGAGVWKTWVDASVNVGRHAPVKAQPDVDASVELAQWASDGQLTLEELSRIVEVFLADQEVELVREGHPLRLLPARISRYVNRLAAPQPAAEEEVAAEVHAAVAGGA